MRRGAKYRQEEIWNVLKVCHNFFGRGAEYEKVKPFTYHGLKKEELRKVIKSGLSPYGGVYGVGVYTKLSPRKTVLDYYEHDAIICIGLWWYKKNAVVLERKRDWVVIPSYVHSKSFLFVAEIEEIEEGEDMRAEYIGKQEGIPLYKIYAHTEHPHALFNQLLGRIACQHINARNLPYQYFYLPVVEKAFLQGFPNRKVK